MVDVFLLNRKLMALREYAEGHQSSLGVLVLVPGLDRAYRAALIEAKYATRRI